MRNVIRRLMGKPVQLSPKQEEKMARAYARADRITAEREAEAAKARAEYEAFMASQGLEVQPAPDVAAAPTNLREIGAVLKQSFEGFKDAVGETFDDRRDVLDPGDADLNKPPAEVEDPAERERIAAAERGARAAPERRSARPREIAFTRFATTGQEQLADVSGRCVRGSPEPGAGLRRLPRPDRYELRRGKEGDARIDWEIAHAPGATAAAGEAAMTGFKRSDHWAARRPGEPSVLDEDVAGELIARAGVRPEDSFGLHRLLTVRADDSSDARSWDALVEGILLFSRPLAGDRRRAGRDDRRRRRCRSAPPPFLVEVLDWEAVAAWVSPFRYGPQRVPSPLPHLPSTWQELVASYVQVVGLQPQDTYGVQVTRSDDRMLADLSMASYSRNLRGRRMS